MHQRRRCHYRTDLGLIADYIPEPRKPGGDRKRPDVEELLEHDPHRRISVELLTLTTALLIAFDVGWTQGFVDGLLRRRPG